MGEGMRSLECWRGVKKAKMGGTEGIGRWAAENGELEGSIEGG